MQRQPSFPSAGLQSRLANERERLQANFPNIIPETNADEFEFLDAGSQYENWQSELNGRTPFVFNERWAGHAFEVGPSSSASERYVNTSTWKVDPLRTHGGTGANLLLRWNNVPADVGAIDVIVHLHGYIGQPANEHMLRTVVGYSGLDLRGRVRPTLGILPRGRLITPEEVRRNQARLDERARQSGKKPQKARSDVQTFPGLLPDGGAGLEALISGALQWFAQQRGGGAPLPVARLILTAHSGGGGALDRLLASHARRRVCDPDEVHAFDALYSEAGGLKSWVTARLGVDRSRQSNQLDSLGGALRVFYRPNTETQLWSELLGRSLPPPSDALSRFYRIDCTRLGHFEIPRQFGPALLRDRTADLSSFGPCASGARSTPAAAPVGPRSNQASGPLVSPARTPLPTDVQAWIRSTDRSAIELVADETLRRRFLQEIDWSREYFPGNLDAQNRRAPGRLAEELFNAMARVTPERRVPRGVRFHDVTRIIVGVPGQTDHKLFPEARDAFVRMRDEAAADGVPLEIMSSWRSVARQQAARLRQSNPNAVAPGISAHNYGLAIDLNMRVPGLTLVNVSTRARDKMANMVRMYRSPIYKWLALNASRLGWFPYKREPWHWEYNPPGLKERFEGNAGLTRGEFEFESGGGLQLTDILINPLSSPGSYGKPSSFRNPTTTAERCIDGIAQTCPTLPGLEAVSQVGGIGFEYIGGWTDKNDKKFHGIIKPRSGKWIVVEQNRRQNRVHHMLPRASDGLATFIANMKAVNLPLEAILTMGSVVCRCISNTTILSNHSYGDAIDIGGLRFVGGKEVLVANSGDASDRNLLHRANACLRLSFATVLDYHDPPRHWNHFHCDTNILNGGERRWDVAWPFVRESLGLSPKGGWDKQTANSLRQFAGADAVKDQPTLNRTLSKLFMREANRV